MKYFMYALKDVVSGVFSFPMLSVSKELAKREMVTIINNDRLITRPQDYDFYFIGEYDDITGETEPGWTPQFCVHGFDLIRDNTPPAIKNNEVMSDDV